MLRLVLLRHAKSSWADSRLDDHDRPLSKRGHHDAPRMGERLRARGAKPGLILASSAARARATAELVATALGDGASARVEIVPELYHASARALLAVAAGQDPRIHELMLVAHNPGMTELANRLLPGLDLANLPTSGVVGIDFDTDDWAALETARPRLAYYDYPKNPLPVVSPD